MATELTLRNLSEWYDTLDEYYTTETKDALVRGQVKYANHMKEKRRRLVAAANNIAPGGMKENQHEFLKGYAEPQKRQAFKKLLFEGAYDLDQAPRHFEPYRQRLMEMAKRHKGMSRDRKPVKRPREGMTDTLVPTANQDDIEAQRVQALQSAQQAQERGQPEAARRMGRIAGGREFADPQGGQMGSQFEQPIGLGGMLGTTATRAAQAAMGPVNLARRLMPWGEINRLEDPGTYPVPEGQTLGGAWNEAQANLATTSPMGMLDPIGTLWNAASPLMAHNIQNVAPQGGLGTEALGSVAEFFAPLPGYKVVGTATGAAGRGLGKLAGKVAPKTTEAVKKYGADAMSAAEKRIADTFVYGDAPRRAGLIGHFTNLKSMVPRELEGFMRNKDLLAGAAKMAGGFHTLGAAGEAMEEGPQAGLEELTHLGLQNPFVSKGTPQSIGLLGDTAFRNPMTGEGLMGDVGFGLAFGAAGKRRARSQGIKKAQGISKEIAKNKKRLDEYKEKLNPQQRKQLEDRVIELERKGGDVEGVAAQHPEVSELITDTYKRLPDLHEATIERVRTNKPLQVLRSSEESTGLLPPSRRTYPTSEFKVGEVDKGDMELPAITTEEIRKRLVDVGDGVRSIEKGKESVVREALAEVKIDVNDDAARAKAIERSKVPDASPDEVIHGMLAEQYQKHINGELTALENWMKTQGTAPYPLGEPVVSRKMMETLHEWAFESAEIPENVNQRKWSREILTYLHLEGYKARKKGATKAEKVAVEAVGETASGEMTYEAFIKLSERLGRRGGTAMAFVNPERNLAKAKDQLKKLETLEKKSGHPSVAKQLEIYGLLVRRAEAADRGEKAKPDDKPPSDDETPPSTPPPTEGGPPPTPPTAEGKKAKSAEDTVVEGMDPETRAKYEALQAEIESYRKPKGEKPTPPTETTQAERPPVSKLADVVDVEYLDRWRDGEKGEGVGSIADRALTRIEELEAKGQLDATEAKELDTLHREELDRYRESVAQKIPKADENKAKERTAQRSVEEKLSTPSSVLDKVKRVKRIGGVGPRFDRQVSTLQEFQEGVLLLVAEGTEASITSLRNIKRNLGELYEALVGPQERATSRRPGENALLTSRAKGMQRPGEAVTEGEIGTEFRGKRPNVPRYAEDALEAKDVSLASLIPAVGGKTADVRKKTTGTQQKTLQLLRLALGKKFKPASSAVENEVLRFPTDKGERPLAQQHEIDVTEIVTEDGVRLKLAGTPEMPAKQAGQKSVPDIPAQFNEYLDSLFGKAKRSRQTGGKIRRSGEMLIPIKVRQADLPKLSKSLRKLGKRISFANEIADRVDAMYAKALENATEGTFDRGRGQQPMPATPVQDVQLAIPIAGQPSRHAPLRGMFSSVEGRVLAAELAKRAAFIDDFLAKERFTAKEAKAEVPYLNAKIHHERLQLQLAGAELDVEGVGKVKVADDWDALKDTEAYNELEGTIDVGGGRIVKIADINEIRHTIGDLGLQETQALRLLELVSTKSWYDIKGADGKVVPGLRTELAKLTNKQLAAFATYAWPPEKGEGVRKVTSKKDDPFNDFVIKLTGGTRTKYIQGRDGGEPKGALGHALRIMRDRALDDTSLGPHTVKGEVTTSDKLLSGQKIGEERKGLYAKPPKAGTRQFTDVKQASEFLKQMWGRLVKAKGMTSDKTFGGNEKSRKVVQNVVNELGRLSKDAIESLTEPWLPEALRGVRAQVVAEGGKKSRLTAEGMKGGKFASPSETFYKAVGEKLKKGDSPEMDAALKLMEIVENIQQLRKSTKGWEPLANDINPFRGVEKQAGAKKGAGAFEGDESRAAEVLMEQGNQAALSRGKEITEASEGEGDVAEGSRIEPRPDRKPGGAVSYNRARGGLERLARIAEADPTFLHRYNGKVADEDFMELASIVRDNPTSDWSDDLKRRAGKPYEALRNKAKEHGTELTGAETEKDFSLTGELTLKGRARGPEGAEEVQFGAAPSTPQPSIYGERHAELQRQRTTERLRADADRTVGLRAQKLSDLAIANNETGDSAKFKIVADLQTAKKKLTDLKVKEERIAAEYRKQIMLARNKAGLTVNERRARRELVEKGYADWHATRIAQPRQEARRLLLANLALTYSHVGDYNGGRVPYYLENVVALDGMVDTAAVEAAVSKVEVAHAVSPTPPIMPKSGRWPIDPARVELGSVHVQRITEADGSKRVFTHELAPNEAVIVIPGEGGKSREAKIDLDVELPKLEAQINAGEPLEMFQKILIPFEYFVTGKYKELAARMTDVDAVRGREIDIGGELAADESFRDAIEIEGSRQEMDMPEGMDIPTVDWDAPPPEGE